jgi:hypothetical protein
MRLVCGYGDLRGYCTSCVSLYLAGGVLGQDACGVSAPPSQEGMCQQPAPASTNRVSRRLSDSSCPRLLFAQVVNQKVFRAGHYGGSKVRLPRDDVMHKGHNEKQSAKQVIANRLDCVRNDECIHMMYIDKMTR